MIRRGKKSPKQAALLKLRKSACADYHLHGDGKCEVSHVLKRDESCSDWMRSHRLPGIELHHVCGRGQESQECPSNYLLAERAAHAWGHDVSPRAFELACLYVKILEHEADVDLLGEICGHATLRNRIEYLAEGQSEVFQGLAAELLEFLPVEE